MKRKTITLVVYMLVCISLVSVGFAAWVITGGDNTEASGNVQAAAVADHSLTISNEYWTSAKNPTATNATKVGKIVFGRPETINNTNKWLQASSTDDPQKLSDTYQFDIECDPANNEAGEATQFLSSVVGGVELSLTEGAELESAISNGYIQEATFTVRVDGTEYDTSVPQTGLIGYKDGDIESAIMSEFKNCTQDYKVTVYITINYKWGFNKAGDNPFTYYGNVSTENMNTTAQPLFGKDSETRSYKVQAKEALEAIYAADGNAISFTITFTTAGAE